VSLQRAAAAPPPSAVTAREAGGWVRVRRLPSDTADSATQRRPVFSRWFPGGPLAVPVPLGARLPVAARTEDAVRLRLADGVEVWVSAADVDSLVRPRRELVPLGPIHVTEREGMVELSVMAPEPLASTADIERNQFRWSIYGARHGSTAVDPARPSDFLRATERRNGPRGRADFVLRLAESPTGWRARWQDGRLVLQVRRPWPAKRGVAGLVVALDAGHPPAGATGPTGLREDSLTLAVARAAARKLAALGARPLLVRPDQRPLSLEARIARAEVANADLFVSIHVNAPADARPPALADGTETFFAQPFAERLAWALQDSVSAHMRQHWRDVTESDLAVLRATWFPAALVEGTCLVLPEREAWLRTPAGIDAYSSGIVAGVTRWVSETAGS
jgi:N-acetylmuramoyl-L-alanine amidase